MTDAAARRAAALMAAFAERTGLTSSAPPRRYLWTDAFAVCNYLGLAAATSDARFIDIALDLVNQVHHVLGRHHPDDPRTGWISGLEGGEAEAHPTRGGLRIGKPLPERGPDEPLDQHLEWDRDGQYFHYLTKWMHALDQTSRATGDPRFNVWARELAETAHSAFVQGPPGRRQMAWKMGTDLSRPLVPSMGQHDPLDGMITCIQLETTARLFATLPGGPSLDRAIREFEALSHTIDVRTTDPLGLGGLLTDAVRVTQLPAAEALEGGNLLASLLDAALEGLSWYVRMGGWRESAHRRLAFRELGLAIGLAGCELPEDAGRSGALETRNRDRLESLRSFLPLGEAIEAFWLEPAHQAVPTWSEHRDINEVMLATRLAPAGFLVLRPVARGA
jgi:hypothetical protein